MDTRRDFIKKGLVAGATAATLPSLGSLVAAGAPASGGAPDLITVKGEDRVAMLDRALEAFGGIGAFVKKGQKVVIKPNIAWDKPPELCANTHPDIVARLVTLCLGAGASEVSVFDNTCDKWDKSYKTSGIADAARAAGARVLPANADSYYRDVEIPGGVSIKKVKVHTAVLDSDVFINVPVLKHHGGATMTACMKNLMGIVSKADQSSYHRNGLHQCIADILRFKKPDLNILDAFSPMMRNGPKGVTVADLDTSVKQLLISRDIVAIDAAASRIMGHKRDIEHVRIAAEAGHGRNNLGELKIERVRMTA
ncbi:DUF362 domain-containing protein [Ereboglobus luteus]|uniref:Tat (Twin-arginine translocation) pathway signal sequence n=1 Tax=Ereboglobus luteus TaxID=1796921 RepID=A0A2U8E633_9BACT|nr:DUF362 domain-containing protein [Ereboglobus luteus]AWI10014.1 tat (twin-arginine translocation) pathway signal sequence [Ereboglobus luteus]